MNVTDRACQHLDDTRHDDPSRAIIMDLLDEIEMLIERLDRATFNEREACAKIADAFAEVAARVDGGIAKSDAAAAATNIASAIRNRT